MSNRNFIYRNWRGDDEEDVPEERPKSDIMMFSKKLEKLFFDNRSVHLWGVVDDKSARDVVSKLLLLDADKTGEEIKFYINSPGGVVTSGMDRIFPKDLPVGVVSDVKPGPSFKQIRVRPSASLEKLEEVIVLLTTDPLSLKTDAPVAGNAAAAPASPSVPASPVRRSECSRPDRIAP